LPTKKLTKIGLLIAISMIFSYIEMLIPIMPSVPGVKIGLSNSVVLLILYSYGFGYCILFQVARLLLQTLLFGNVFSLAYSFVGAFVSLIVMYFVKKFKLFDMPGVSMFGGVAHNIGQILVAFFLVQNQYIFSYFPVLLISGSLCGYGVGWISEILFKRKLME